MRIKYKMSHKQEIKEPNLDVQEAKELELAEQPKPTRKISHPNVPVPEGAEPSTTYRKKGKRKIKM